MKIITLSKVLSTLYKRNIKKNTLMVIFMIFTNISLMLFLLFFSSNEALLTTLSSSYLEHLSVDVSLYESQPTNNSLINVKTYKRPTIDYLNSIMRVTDNFKIRPDYSPLLADKTLFIFDKEIPNILITILGENSEEVGINRALYKELLKAASFSNEEIIIRFSLATTLFIDEEETKINYEHDFRITYIYDEPTYFSSPKLYIPQNMIDATLGSIFIKSGVTLNNYLLNLNAEHELTNYRYKCHFKSVAQKEKFMSIVHDVSTKEQGIEVSGDYISKVESFTALYSYLSILIKLFLAFVIIGSVVIYVVIAHTSLLAILRQMALFAILGAKSKDLYYIYLFLISINFLLSIVSFVLLPYFLPLLSRLLYKLLGVCVALTLNYKLLIFMISVNFITLLVILTVIFLINMRKPLLYLLIDD